MNDGGHRQHWRRFREQSNARDPFIYSLWTRKCKETALFAHSFVPELSWLLFRNRHLSMSDLLEKSCQKVQFLNGFKAIETCLIDVSMVAMANYQRNRLLLGPPWWWEIEWCCVDFYICFIRSWIKLTLLCRDRPWGVDFKIDPKKTYSNRPLGVDSNM